MAKRKALGKGLSALIPNADKLDDREEEFFQCPVEMIEPNPYQPRKSFSPDELDEMVASVREKGIITPLLVSRTEAGYQLIAGERRWRAAQKAGLARVPVVVRESTPSESLELALIENIHRKDLNPIEEAGAYGKLLEETGMTQDALAKRLGKDRSSITNLLRLLKLPVKIQQDVIDGLLSMGHARLLAGLKDHQAQKAMRDAVVKKGLSVRQAEALAKKGKGSANARGKRTVKDPYLRSLEDNLKRSLGTKVEIKRRGGKGNILVYFYSDDELDRLLERLA
ncbi:MAG: ParB/RepB/Spo0J family partition protein [Proteobacteria bacterium]|jgi:ParB family chromosome partitioning protein|nr:ParB/RepB/Spo0J family partition protein [Pseudomonadota bacterium]MBU1905302.1 ParB/RepB/Spo0J family partition protein [Pseudomonadota bacterium]